MDTTPAAQHSNQEAIAHISVQADTIRETVVTQSPPTDRRVFDAQFTLLRDEIELINSSIRQFDEITKSIKEWAVLSWTAAVGISLQQLTLRPFINLTALIPLLFWVVDTSYRRVQRRFIFRISLISDYIDANLPEAVKRGEMSDFRLLDPLATHAPRQDRIKFSAWLRVGGFATIATFYGGLTLTSLLLYWLIN
jgi:hypothetical protein